MTLVDFVMHGHEPDIVLLASIMAVTGTFVTLRLYRRAARASETESLGWLLLAALISGATIWTSHFVAMLGYRAPIPVTFDAGLTAVSLLVAIVGSGMSFWLTMAIRGQAGKLLGGGAFGLWLAAMHYIGMLAYHVEGPISWHIRDFATSLLAAVLFSTLALCLAQDRHRGKPWWLAEVMMILAILLMHFLGMSALHISPMEGMENGASDAAFQATAVTIFTASLIVIATGVSTALIDVRARAHAREEMQRMALRDPLTGLPNRADFHAHLDALLIAEAGRRKVAVIGIDLTFLKEINDIWGYPAGDAVLCVIGKRLAEYLRPAGYVARTGGDEFYGVLAFEHEAELHRFLEILRDRVTAPIVLAATSVSVGASIGVALFPQHAESRETLISNADLAMYAAKTDPVAHIRIYEAALGEAMRNRAELMTELRRAVEFGGLDLHYQVQQSIVTGEITGFEALLRWDHPRLGRISPAEFIPLAESNGLILPLGEWVLWRACTDAKHWRLPYKVAVNLSPVQLANPRLPQVVAAILADTGLPPEQLELELTETAIIRDKARSLAAIGEIKALGVSIALDDFGTGYSSLDTLKTFPFDKIKLDRTFVEELALDPRSMAIVRAVLALGKSLGIPVLAEGIETPEQLALLRAEGCDEVQGFLIGRPGAFSDGAPEEEGLKKAAS